jgi:hypothetical protein
MPIIKYELMNIPELEENINNYNKLIEQELHSPDKSMQVIIFWQLCIMEIRFEMLARRIK